MEDSLKSVKFVEVSAMENHNVWIAPGAVVKGNVGLGEHSSVWYNAVIRADFSPIDVGAYTNIQDNCVLHVERDAPVCVGDYVTVGHGAILHGCSVGDNSLIGMGAIVLNHAVIGKNCIIGAGALVTEGKVIPDGSLVIGVPGKIVRELTSEEIAHNHLGAEHYAAEASKNLEHIDVM